MSTKKRKASDKQEEDEAFLLGRFLDFEEGSGLDEFCRFLMHCGIGLDDIDYMAAISQLPSSSTTESQTEATTWTLRLTISSAGHRSQPASRS